MSDKNINFKANIDSSQLDRQMEALKQKVKNMQQMSQLGPQIQQTFSGKGGMSDYTKTFFGDFNRDSINNLREAFNLNYRKLQSESKGLQDKTRELENLQKLEQKLTNQQEKRVESLRKEINLIKERGRTILDTQNVIRNQATSMGSQLEGFEGTTPPIPPIPPAPPGVNARIFKELGGWKNVIGGIGGAIGGASELAMIGAGIGGHRVTRNRMFLGELGQQGGVFNANLTNQFAGQGSKNLFEQGERREALDMAMKEMRGQQKVDYWGGLGKIVGKGTAGMMMGAGAGTVIPGVGNVVGGALGAIGGVGQELTNRRTWNMLFDKGAYQNMLTTEGVQNYQKNLDSQKILNPGKFMAQDNWMKSWQKTQGLERTLGLNTEQLFGSAAEQYTDYGPQLGGKAGVDQRNKNRSMGWLETNQGGMFSRERIEQAAGELLNSGASSSYVAGKGGNFGSGAKFVAQMQQMGLTNAGGAVGKIGGLGGTPDEAFKKLIAEAMSLGIDDSALTDENKKFSNDMRRLLEINQKLYVESGGSSGAVQQFQAGIMGVGGAQLGFAQNAFETRNKMAGESGGARGALKWSFMNSQRGQELFGGVSMASKAWATTANLENLNANDPRVKAMADQMGVEPEEALNRIRTMQSESTYYSAQTDKARSGLKQSYEKFLGGKKDTVQSREEFARSKPGYTAISKFATSAGFQEDEKFNQMNAGEITSFAMGEAMGGKVAGASDADQYLKRIDKALTSPELTKTDTQERSQTKDEISNLKILTDNLNRFADAAERNAEMTIAQTTATNQLRVSIDGLREYVANGGQLTPEMTTIMQGLMEQAYFGDSNNSSSVQPQGGNTRRGK